MVFTKGQNGNAGEYGGAISACGDNGASAIAAVQHSRPE